MQENLVGCLYRGHDTSSGEGFPSFTGPAGPTHSYRLAKYLRDHFNLPEDRAKRRVKLDFWTILQEKGFNLESLYNELEAELTGEARVILEDFAAIVRTAVSEPVGERGPESVCRYHRRLCEALEPGDYIVNFNWDSVIADTLLYHSHLWFPATGFGVNGILPVLPHCQKSLHIESLVQLLPIHGSVVLFELESTEQKGRAVAFLGPRQLSPITGMMELAGIDAATVPLGSSGAFPSPVGSLGAEEKIGAHGYLYYRGTWFKPLFVPPSRSKPHYNHWFFRKLIRFIHAQLPTTRHFVVAGYSFPEADREYLREIFVREVTDSDATVEIVNLANGEGAFRSRAKAAFPAASDISFQQPDFKAYCEGFSVEYPGRSPMPEREAGQSSE